MILRERWINTLLNLHTSLKSYYNTDEKRISVGENSKLKGNKINIQNSEIGITSKDFSVVEIDNITLLNTK